MATATNTDKSAKAAIIRINIFMFYSQQAKKKGAQNRPPFFN